MLQLLLLHRLMELQYFYYFSFLPYYQVSYITMPVPRQQIQILQECQYTNSLDRIWSQDLLQPADLRDTLVQELKIKQTTLYQPELGLSLCYYLNVAITNFCHI